MQNDWTDPECFVYREVLSRAFQLCSNVDFDSLVKLKKCRAFAQAGRAERSCIQEGTTKFRAVQGVHPMYDGKHCCATQFRHMLVVILVKQLK